ncbi:MAG: outer membrane beta-barrel protein [Bacteroidales bacterium]|nr:outer membrane beta-barrel protein [Bacteroidales bacterium]
MKKLSYKSILLLLILMFGISPVFVSGQETGEGKSATNSAFDKYFFLQAFGGMSQFYGDLNEFALYNERANLFYGFGAGYQFSPVLGVRGLFNNGWVVSTRQENSLRMSSSVWDGQLNVTASLTNLIFGYKPERFLNFYVFTGAVYSNYSSVLYNTNGTDENGDDAVIDRNGPDAPDGFDQEAYTAFGLPVGAGFNFRLAEKWDLNLEYNERFIFKDDLDLVESNSKNDAYASLMLGVTYKFLPSANLKSMAKDYGLVKYETTPDPLVKEGDTVCVNVKVTFPEKYFAKKAAMNFQPEIKYAGTTRKLKPVNFQGESVNGDGIVINYKTGGSYTYVDCVPYEPGMNASDLVVSPSLYEPKEPVVLNATPEQITAKYKVIDLPERKLADGVIITGTRIMHDEDLLLVEHGYIKESIVTKDAKIYFKVNMHDLNWNLPLNRTNLVQQKLDELAVFIKQGYTIRDIDINAWASPEGEETYNQGLSERRAQAGKKQVVEMFKKMAKEKNPVINIPDPEASIKFNSYANGEDWNGFMQAVEGSNIADKRIIMNVVNSQSDVAKREQEIRNMSVVYKEIEDEILPPLRRVEIKVNCFEPKKTDEQIATLAVSDPSKLDDKELLYAATLTNDKDTKLRIYKTAATQFPNNYKGYNNAAYIELENGQLGEAATHLAKADQLEPNNKAVVNNLGALASKKGDYKNAATQYGKAKNLGADVNYNMGVVELANNNYDKSLSMLGGKKCNSNVALAQMMTGKNAEAASTLKCAPESGHNYYLLAVIAARGADAKSMIDNLTKAFAKDPSLKAQAADDREFIKFFTNPEFMALVK